MSRWVFHLRSRHGQADPYQVGYLHYLVVVVYRPMINYH